MVIPIVQRQPLRLRNRVCEAREARGWSPEELAVYAGVNRQVVRNIEAGDHNPTAKTMLSLAAALDVELGELFWSEPERNCA